MATESDYFQQLACNGRAGFVNATIEIESRDNLHASNSLSSRTVSLILRNSILAALTESEKSALLRNADREELAPRQTFFAPGVPIRSIFFLEDGMASELVRLSDGRAVDIAPIGIEGLIGLPLLLGATSNHHHSLMQIQGSATRVPATDALRCLNQGQQFRTLVFRYAHARFLQTTQSAACNLLHTIEQRLARWLMVARFHTRKESFGITQEFLAEMLGANRSTITMALRDFEKSGLVNYRRSFLEIINREKLAGVACECYRIVADDLANVVPKAKRGEQEAVGVPGRSRSIV